MPEARFASSAASAWRRVPRAATDAVCDVRILYQRLFRGVGEERLLEEVRARCVSDVVSGSGLDVH